MSEQSSGVEPCQVDFYVLGNPSIRADLFACRLTMMAWERRQKVFLLTNSEAQATELDDLLWEFPQGRFLPHTKSGDVNAARTPVTIGTASDLNPVDVVINLCPEAIAEPGRFGRILEIVPHADEERAASRIKFLSYRDQGIRPQKHEISK